jgi:hypothetical protein
VLWEDVNAKKGLVFLGDRDLLISIYNQIINYFNPVPFTELDRWDKFGIYWISSAY